MLELVSAISIWELVKHTGSWISNLKRAKTTRKQESMIALRKVILAARRTSVYLRQLRETGRQNHQVEAEIAVLWTELGFALEDLGINKLADRCRISGRHWTDPSQTDLQFFTKADIGLSRMEQLANELLRDLKK